MSFPDIQTLQVGINNQFDFKKIRMKQHDKNTRQIDIYLLDSTGQILNIPNTYVAKFQATKPDGKIVFDDCVITDNKISYLASEQLTTVAGNVKCDIGLYETGLSNDKTKDKLIQSTTFYIFVEETAMNRDGVESSDEFQALTIMVNTVTGLVENVEKLLVDGSVVIDNINTAADNAIVATSNANIATTKANAAADNANSKASLADEKANLASVATVNAVNATTEANRATDSANIAATKASTAADDANSKASLADEKAALADTAANNANDKASLANEKAILADNAASKANLATDNASSAADRASVAADSADTATTNAIAAATDADIATNKANTAANNANTKADLANNAAITATDIVDLLESETLKIFKPAVNTYAELLATYPNPEIGWTVNVNGEAPVVSYRYNGNTWVNLGVVSSVDTATNTTLGVVKGGDNVNIDVNGVLSVPVLDDYEGRIGVREKLQTATGTATSIILNGVRLEDGFSITFIANGNNNGSATSINGKRLYKPNTTETPTIKQGEAVTIWFDSTKDCFYTADSLGDALIPGAQGGIGELIPTNADLLGGQSKEYFEALVDAVSAKVTQNIVDIATLNNNLVAHMAESVSKHITESGENENGSYLKFDDGTLICRKGNLVLTRHATDLFRLNSNWTFPHKFSNNDISISSINIRSLFSSRAAAKHRYITSPHFFSTTASVLTGLSVLKTVGDFGESEIGVVSIEAIGRWK